MNTRINLQNLLYWFFLACFSFSSLDSKAAGLAWLSLLFIGFAAVARQRFSGFTSVNNPASDTKLWFFVTVVAVFLKAIPVFYWQDSWAERHAEIRLVFGAFAAYAIARWGSLNASKHQLMAGAASISCALALILMLVDVREAAPTNPIPWAASIALVSAWLLPMSCSAQLTRMSRWFLGLGSLVGLLAVLISENRGSYGLLLLWPVVLFGHSKILRHFRELTVRSTVTQLAVGALVIVIVSVILIQTPLVQRPLDRLKVAMDEIQLSHQSLEANVNGSIGARLYMWSRSVSFIQEAPWIGHGQADRKDAISQWGKDQKSEHVQSLGHVHNEYLHSMMDYGLFGLASLLLYALGMSWFVFRMHARGATTQAWAIAGVLFIHITTGLTNVNFAHNYYPTMLSIVMSLILLTPSSQGGDLKKSQ